MAVGYQFLHESLRLGVFAPERPALVKPVTRVEPTDGFLAIPRNVAPASDDPIEHICSRSSMRVLTFKSWLKRCRKSSRPAC